MAGELDHNTYVMDGSATRSGAIGGGALLFGAASHRWVASGYRVDYDSIHVLNTRDLHRRPFNPATRRCRWQRLR